MSMGSGVEHTQVIAPKIWWPYICLNMYISISFNMQIRWPIGFGQWGRSHTQVIGFKIRRSECVNMYIYMYTQIRWPSEFGQWG